MDKISIIIPVYNVEPYIKKCLDSVINQTYKNLEILLINDGSTDNSGNICDEYAEKDNRVKVYHQEHKGVSSTRNLGLENISGQYVGFVDSDDWIEPEMYQELYNALKDRDIGIGVCNYFKDANNESIPMTNIKRIPEGVISNRNMLLYPLQRDYYMGFCGYLWNKLFSSDVIKESNMNFDKNIKYGGDIVFYTNAVTASKCEGIYVDKPLYYYFQRSDSIAHSKSIAVKLDILSVYKKVENLLTNNVSYWARGFYCHHASVIAEIALENNDKETFSLMKKEIQAHLSDYIKTNEEFPEKFERIERILNG